MKSRHQTIQEYKRRYEEILATLDGRNWKEYWEVMVRNYDWVDYIFIQSAAWFLGHDIIIVTTTSTEDHPYITISGNLVDEKIPCPGIPLTIGSKSNVHYQSLLPLEIRVPRNPIKPSLPVNTINLKVSASSEKYEDPEPDLDSREEFPELKPSSHKRQVQPRNSARKKEVDKSARETNQTDMMKNKDHKKNLEQKRGDNVIYQQGNGHNAFKYQQQGTILNFEFVGEKRIKCPTCKNEFKNIIRHLQQSSCGISNLVEFSEQFKQFSEIHFEKRIKDDLRKRRAKSLAKQREHDKKQVKDDQNMRKAKFMSKQRAGGVQQVKNDHNKWKAKSRAQQRVDGDKQVKNNQNK